MIRSKYQIILLIAFIIFLIRFGISTKDFNRDVVNHIVWTESLIDKGLKGFYERDFSPWAQANYPPLSNLLFYICHKLYLWLKIEASTQNILASFYKLPLLIADTITAFILLKIGTKERNILRGVFLAVIFLVNIALVYNSVFWGQLESLVTVFCLLSLISFYKRNKIWAFIFYALALLTKQSALFFLPVFLIMVIKKTNLKEKLFGFILMYFITVFLFSFFISKDFLTFPATFYMKTMGGQTHQYEASVNAFNFWFLTGLNKVNDDGRFLGITYRAYSIFISFALLTPLLLSVHLKNNLNRVLYATGLVALITFLFLTRMHERHLYPAIVFLTSIIYWPKKFFAYFIISGIHFLNLFLVGGEYLANPSINTIFFGKILSLFSIIIFGYYYFDYFKLIKNDKI